ncbi:MAG: DUF4124 domain-containing protein, partial [Nitrospinae bacterium]|nr:DUF4124 domain-containing protein [Nitrospinota bacterium]
LLFFSIIFIYREISYSETYKWVDDKGEVHFTDNPSNIPPAYSKKVKGIKEKTTLKSPPPDEKDTVIKKLPSSLQEEKLQAEGGISPTDPNAVTIVGDIKEELNNEKRFTYSGLAKNNSNTELNNVEIFFIIKGREGKEVENLSLYVNGKNGKGILESGEVGSFTMQPTTPFSSIAGYGYNFKWKFATKTLTR